MKVKCETCGKEFNRPASRIRKINFCSQHCKALSQNKSNIIEVLDNYALIVISSKKFGEKKIIIDKEDIEKVSNLNWHLRLSSKNYFYAYARARDDKKEKFTMHRLITDCLDENLHIDHINHDTLDNRKSNLRVCTNSQNQQNRKLNVNNKSGQKGVSYIKSLGRWQATISYMNKKIYLGCYENIDDAIEARKTAENKYFSAISLKKEGK